MRSLIYYIERWNITKTSYLIKNVISSALIFCFACYAVRDGVFETYADTKSCLFAVLMCAIWSGIFNSIALFYSESDYTTDDLNKILTVKTYVMANVIVQAGLCIVEGIVDCALFHYWFDYGAEGIYFSDAGFDYAVTFVLVIFSADMLGFATGMLVKDITSAMTLIPALLIAQFLFSGCLFSLEGLLRSLAKFTTARWGFSALGSIADLNDLMLTTSPVSDTSSLFETTRDNLVSCWTHLLVLSVCCCLIAGILLYRKLNSEGDN